VSAVLLATTLALAGCSTSWFTDGFGITGTATPTATSKPSSTPTAAKPTATPKPTTPPIVAWSECPRLVTDLNKNTADPATYAQVKASAFPVQEIGVDLLADACVIAVTTGGETVDWAVLPGDDALAASIKASLIDAGFAAGGIAGTLTNTQTSKGALVSAFPNGAALETFLAGPKGFARITQPLVYVGTFFLS
jgi:hypothetical protein